MPMLKHLRAGTKISARGQVYKVYAQLPATRETALINTAGVVEGAVHLLRLANNIPIRSTPAGRASTRQAQQASDNIRRRARDAARGAVFSTTTSPSLWGSPTATTGE